MNGSVSVGQTLFIPTTVNQRNKRGKQLVKVRQPLSIEYRLYHKESQQYRWMLVRAFPQRSSSGTIKRWVGMNTDIANRKLRELELADREAHLRASSTICSALSAYWIPTAT